MKIRIDKADAVFSEYIRRRDGRCMRCGKAGTGPKGILGLQCSHYFGRARESTRFANDNCIALCWGCHQYWGSTDREAYRKFMIRNFGEKRFAMLTVQANLPVRKDRKLALIKSKYLLSTLENSQKVYGEKA